MARERISLVSEQEQTKDKIRYDIEQGLLDNTVYQSLSLDEQNNVKSVLFEMYSQPVVQPVAFSALEFAVFGLGKLFFKVNSGTPLTTDEQAFYDRFKQFVEQHEITLNASDWYVPYAEDKMLATKNNRAEYKQKKIDITGAF